MSTLEEVEAGMNKAQQTEAQKMEDQKVGAQRVKAQKNEARMEFQKWKALRQGTRNPEHEVPEQFKVAGPDELYDVPQQFRHLFDGRRAIGSGILPNYDALMSKQTASGPDCVRRNRLTSPPPPSFDHPATLRKQDQLIDRENRRTPRSGHEHFRLIYGTGKPPGQGMTIPEKVEEEGRVDLPAYSQAYNNESAAQLEQSSAYISRPPPGFNLPSLPGLGPHILHQSKSHGPKSSNSQHKFIPISKSAFFPTQSSPSPPQERATESVLDTLRAEFDNKLSLLGECLERKIGTDAQNLSTIRDLEMKLKQSEAEKEKYKERVAELEKKAAMMKGWRD